MAEDSLLGYRVGEERLRVKIKRTSERLGRKERIPFQLAALIIGEILGGDEVVSTFCFPLLIELASLMLCYMVVKWNQI